MKITVTEKHLNKALEDANPNTWETFAFNTVRRPDDYCEKCLIAQAIQEAFPGMAVTVEGSTCVIGGELKYCPAALDFVLLYDGSMIDNIRKKLPAEIELFNEDPFIDADGNYCN